MTKVQVLLQLREVQSIITTIKPHVVPFSLSSTSHINKNNHSRKSTQLDSITQKDLSKTENSKNSGSKVKSLKLSIFKSRQKPTQPIQIETENNIENSQILNLGYSYIGRLLKKSFTKIIQKNRRRNLEEHKDKTKKPNFTDGLFEIFFPEIFVLEYKKGQAKNALNKNSRKISTDLIRLASSVVKCAALSVQACSKIPTSSHSNFCKAKLVKSKYL